MWAQGAWETGLRAPHREPGTPLADSAEVPPPSGSHPTSPGADQPRITRPCHFWSSTLGERSELLPVPSRSGLFETALDSGLARREPQRVSTTDLPPDDAVFDIPRIPASAGALIFDPSGRLLVLKPTYKGGWTLPGGQMEDNGETPWEACTREVQEETGLVLDTGRLVCVDFLRPRPGRPGGNVFSSTAER